jgi:hypothetical protein
MHKDGEEIKENTIKNLENYIFLFHYKRYVIGVPRHTV